MANGGWRGSLKRKAEPGTKRCSATWSASFRSCARLSRARVFQREWALGRSEPGSELTTQVKDTIATTDRHLSNGVGQLTGVVQAADGTCPLEEGVSHVRQNCLQKNGKQDGKPVLDFVLGPDDGADDAVLVVMAVAGFCRKAFPQS